MVELPLPELLPVPLPELVPELVPDVDVPLLLVPEAAGAAGLEDAGGVAAGAADWLDGCLAQAVRSSAAASALRATLVFIDSTPVE